MNLEKNNSEFKDNFVESVLLNANHKVLMDDFDCQIMDSIRLKYELKQDISSKLRTSMRYFLIAILLIVAYPIFIIITKTFNTQLTSITSILMLFFSIGVGIVFTLNYRRLIQKSLLDY